MDFAPRHLIWTLLLAIAPAFASEPPAPPLPDPHLGEWRLDSADRGMTGERILIEAGKVTIPAMGEFCAALLKQSTNLDEYGSRYYLATLNLSQHGACSIPDERSLRLEMKISIGFRNDASAASMTIYRAGHAEALLVADGWNFERESPCETSGSGPVTQCAGMEHARVYKRLAYTAYSLQRSLPKREAARFAKGFDPARFAIDVAAFCDKRESDRGGANWPTYWAMMCTEDRLDAKLVELDKFSACIDQTGYGRTVPNPVSPTTCKMPGSRFDRTKRPADDD